MSQQTRGSASGSSPLPDAANIEWLRKHAKQRLRELKRTDPDAKLADAQRDVAREYGFQSWRALKAHVDGLTVDGQLIAAADEGNAGLLAALVDANPEKLYVRKPPYEWTLLHVAAQKGHAAVVDLLLRRGFDVNVREKGDNTSAMHWAAAAGHVEIVRRLIEAGGDVIGHGDDHELEVIGWATCWDGCDDEAHRATTRLLLEHGARHHVFSATAMNDGEELRRIVGSDPSALNRRMSRNEANQTVLQFAIRFPRPAMVALLVELGADPLGVDAEGFPPAMYATAPDVDRPVMERIRSLTRAEIQSADRGGRRVNAGVMDLLASASLEDWTTAARIVRDDPGLLHRGGALHLAAKRGDVPAVRWLLKQGAEASSLWNHWDAAVTPLHLAAAFGHPKVVELLLTAGADPRIKDSKHDSTPLGWAEFFGQIETVRLLRARG